MVVLHQQNVQLVLARGVGERRDGRRVVRLRIGIGRPRGGFHGGRSRDRARRHRLRTVTNVPPRERRLTRAVARDASARFRPGRAVRSKRRRDGRCRAKAVIRAFASPATRAPCRVTRCACARTRSASLRSSACCLRAVPAASSAERCGASGALATQTSTVDARAAVREILSTGRYFRRRARCCVGMFDRRGKSGARDDSRTTRRFRRIAKRID